MVLSDLDIFPVPINFITIPCVQNITAKLCTIVNSRKNELYREGSRQDSYFKEKSPWIKKISKNLPPFSSYYGVNLYLYGYMINDII